jgi:leader peptidase (prepilin peptidase)/N-methyltransferase
MSGHVMLAACLAPAGLALGWVQHPLITRYVPRASSRVVTPPGAGATTRDLVRPSALASGIVTAVVFVLLGACVQSGFVLGAACALAVIAVPLAFVDAAVHRLPDPLTIAAYAVTVADLLIAAADGGHWGTMGRAAAGGAALGGFYLLLAVISPSGMGLGDVKLAASLGTLLAWLGWRTLVLGAFAGFMLAALYSVALLAFGRTTRKQQIPFGPFMLAGAFLLLLVTA